MGMREDTVEDLQGFLQKFDRLPDGGGELASKH